MLLVNALILLLELFMTGFRRRVLMARAQIAPPISGRTICVRYEVGEDKRESAGNERPLRFTFRMGAHPAAGTPIPALPIPRNAPRRLGGGGGDHGVLCCINCASTDCR